MWRGRRCSSYLMRPSAAELPLVACRWSRGERHLPSAVVPTPSLWTEGATRRRGYWAGPEDTLTAHRESTQHRARANSWPRPKKEIHDLAQHDSSKVQTKKNIQARTHHVHSGLTFHHVQSSTGESRSCMLLTSTSTFSQKKNLLVIHAKHTQKKKRSRVCGGS